MRMWKVNPKLLCNKHLLGEHCEMHMFVGTLNKNISVLGYINKGLVEIENIKNRHNELANELIKRNMQHNSPLTEYKSFNAGKVNDIENLKILQNRCLECKRKILCNQ